MPKGLWSKEQGCHLVDGPERRGACWISSDVSPDPDNSPGVRKMKSCVQRV